MLAGVESDHGLHAAVHGAQMHRHVRRIGHQRAGLVEDRAGEIEPFLDVDRMRRVLQRHAHLLGDVHEQVVEHLEQDRDRPRAFPAASVRVIFSWRRINDVVAGGQLGGPARFDHQRSGFCSMISAGPFTRSPGASAFAGEDRGIKVPAAAEHRHPPVGACLAARGRGCCARLFLFAGRSVISSSTASTVIGFSALTKPNCAFVCGLEPPRAPPPDRRPMPPAGWCRCRRSAGASG